MTFETWFEKNHSSIPLHSVPTVLALAQEGATIPFMARYRKEQTGNLDEVGIQTILEAKESWDELIKRQSFILEEITKQGKMTDALKTQILSTFDRDKLEDLYLPYKQKRKTKAALAKEAGLEPLADWLWQCAHGEMKPEKKVEEFAESFKNEEKKITDAGQALGGAQDILIERVSEMPDLRELVRKTIFEKGFLITAKTDEAKTASKFERYFQYQEKISSLLKPENSHRYLAVRRGWDEKELSLKIGSGDEENGYEKHLLTSFENRALSVKEFEGAWILQAAARMAFKAHVLSSVETEAHRELKKIADEMAIKVFSENVRKLLLASPFGPKAVLGVDPGIRTGCKLALVDSSGKFLDHAVMYLRTDEEKKQSALLLQQLFKKITLQGIAIGNGTAGRETEQFIRAVVKELNLTLPVVMVSEAGASVYSASEVAREEFPDLDLTVRGAISIARRFQDPLAELVKVDPKSIGVGQYQHDVSPHALKKGLSLVVDSCVNAVGVNLNTASSYLLAHVSGIGPGLAQAIVDYRAKKGLIQNRQDLLKIPRFTEKVFEQAAGFLRIPDSGHPLDNTGVHPEQYPLLEALAQQLGKSVADLTGSGVSLVRQAKDFQEKVGPFTFKDIVTELEKPGRDPRAEFVPMNFRDDIHEIADLKLGMMCPGIVTNVTNFGAFVDIGVHQDGLVHISQLSDQYVKDPRDVVNPGDRVMVKVLEIHSEKKQIALTMKKDERPAFSTPQSKRDFRPASGNAPRGFSKAPPVPMKPKQQPFNNPFAALAQLKK